MCRQLYLSSRGLRGLVGIAVCVIVDCSRGVLWLARPVSAGVFLCTMGRNLSPLLLKKKVTKLGLHSCSYHESLNHPRPVSRDFAVSIFS